MRKKQEGGGNKNPFLFIMSLGVVETSERKRVPVRVFDSFQGDNILATAEKPDKLNF